MKAVTPRFRGAIGTCATLFSFLKPAICAGSKARVVHGTSLKSHIDSYRQRESKMDLLGGKKVL